MNDFSCLAGQFRNLLTLPDAPTAAATAMAEELLRNVRHSDFSRPAFEFFLDALGIENVLGNQVDQERGMWRAFPGLGELLDAVFSVQSVDPDDEAEWIEAFKTFKDAMNARASKRVRPEKETVKKQFNVLGYFLFGVRRDVLRKSEGSSAVRRQRWLNVCLAGFRATALALNQTMEESLNPTLGTMEKQRERLDQSARMIAAALENLPISRAEKVRVRIDEESISVALEIAKSRGDIGPSTKKNYCRRASAYLGGRWYNFHGRGGGGVRGPADEEDENEPEIDAKQWDSVDDDFTAEKDIAEGGCREEWEVPPEVRRVAAKTPGTVAFSRSFVPPGLAPMWSGRFITAEAFGVLLAALLGNGTADFFESENLTVFGLLLVLLNFGFDPGLALTIEAGGENVVSGNTIAFDGDGFWIQPRSEADAPVLGETETDTAYFLPSSVHFRLPTPQSVSAYIHLIRSYNLISGANAQSEIETPNRLFLVRQSFPGWPDRAIPLSEAIVDNTLFLATEKLRREQGFVLDGKPVRLRRVARTATALLRHVGGLDELTSALIRGRVPRHLVPQCHYSNVDVSEIIDAHRRAVEKTIAFVIEKSAPAIAELGLLPIRNQISEVAVIKPESGITAPERDPDGVQISVVTRFEDFSDLLDTDQSDPETPISIPSRFGSPFVPRTESVREYLSRMHASLADKTVDWRVRRNRLVVYVGLICMYATGVRPSEIEHLSPYRVGWMSRRMYLAVEAKRNKHYSEWRKVGIPVPVPDWFELLETVGGEATNTIIRRYANRLEEHFTPDRQSSVFWLLTGRFLPRRLSVGNLGEWLKDDEENAAGPFPWRLNSSRHLFRTEAVRMGEARSEIDALLGHMTRGRESLGLFSALPSERVIQAGERISSRLVDVLGIKPPEIDPKFFSANFTPLFQKPERADFSVPGLFGRPA